MARKKTKSKPKRVNGQGSIYRRQGSPIWYIAWRDVDGKRCIEKTGTENPKIAEDILKKRQDEVAAVLGGTADPRILKLAEQRRVPLARHIEDYLSWCQLEGQVQRHLTNKRAHLERAVAFIGATHLPAFADLSAGCRFLSSLELQGLSPRTRNAYRQDLIGFLNWLVKADRWADNSFRDLPKADETLDRRLVRRAFTASEVKKFLSVARLRDEATRGRSWGGCREAVYVTAVMTGLRKGELQKLEWRDVDLDRAVLTVRAEVSKSKRLDEVPLHRDVVEVLSSFRPQPRPLPRARVFRSMPTVRTFRMDLSRAGIERVDEEGCVLDFHSLRHTTATLLALLATPPAIAMELMRHARVETTLKHYTHLRSNEKSDAMDRMPSLLSDDETRVAEVVGSEAAATQAATPHDLARSDGKIREDRDDESSGKRNEVADNEKAEHLETTVSGGSVRSGGSGEVGAGDRARTDDIQLGKLTLYQLSYTRS